MYEYIALLYAQPVEDALDLLHADAGPAINAAAMPTAFSPRTWSIGGRRKACRAFLLLEGEAAAQLPDGGELDLSAPALLWLPRANAGAFRLAAGGRGLTFAANEDMAWQVIADSAIAADLRGVMSAPIAVSGEALAARFDELWVHFEVLLRESRNPVEGSAAVLAFTLGLILVHIWRGGGAAGGETTSQAGLVPRFRQLIEMHFRQGLTVPDYARLLGVTRGRLHHACRTGAGQTPLAMIHARLLAEACVRLSGTDMPVEQVGFSLGFRDAGYFNRFFVRQTGQTPGAFRRAASGAPAEPASFAAWP